SGVVTARSENADSDAANGGDEESRKRQFHRHRQTLDDDLRHWTGEANGIAKVTLGNVADVIEELDPNGLVQPEAAFKFEAGCVADLVAQHGFTGVAWDQTGEGER